MADTPDADGPTPGAAPPPDAPSPSSTAIVPADRAQVGGADDDASPSPESIPDPPMPPAPPAALTRLRRPPRVFRRLREWVQERLLKLVAALGEFLALFAFVLSVVLGSIFVLTNRIVLQQVMTPGLMGGSYAPDTKARYAAGDTGQAFSIGFANGLPSKPVPIAASGAALPAVRPKLADEARAENTARDALLAAAGGFQASADTKAALAAPVLSSKLLASLAAAGAGASAARVAIPTRGTGPPPTRAVPSPSPTSPPTATVPTVPSPTVAPTRPPTSPTVAPTQASGPPTAAPTVTIVRTATPPPTIVATTATPAPPSATVLPSATRPPPTPTVAVPSPTVAATVASPSPSGGTPTVPVLPTVTAAPASPTAPVPPSPTTAPSPTPNVSPTVPPPPTPTNTPTPTLTPTPTPTATPTRTGGPTPTALAVLDLSRLVGVPGQPIITTFPGIFSTASSPDPVTGVVGTPGPLNIGGGRDFSRTLLFVNASNKPIDFISQTGVDPTMADNPLWADIENGIQMEITINGVTRYNGPLDTTRAPTPPFLERIPANDLLSIGFRIFLPATAGNDMARQTVVFNLEFAITLY